MDESQLVLITGATGYIGSYLARRLLAEGRVRVRAIARQAPRAEPLRALGADVVLADLTRPETLAQALQGVSVVFHSAGWADDRGRRDEIWAVNVEGTRHLADAALDAHVTRLVHLSSCAVYGSLQAFNIDERTPLRTGASLYHDSKVAAEAVVWDAARHGLATVIARPSQVYGPGSAQFTIRPIHTIQRRRMFLIDGGRHMFKPVYIDNLVDGLLLCGWHPSAVGEAFNLTDGVAIPWRSLFRAYANMLGVSDLPSLPYPLAWCAAGALEFVAALRGKSSPVTRRAAASLRSTNSFSNQKARKLLGWEPKVGFEEALHRTQVWLRAEGKLPTGT